MSVFRTGSDLLLGQPVLKFGEAIVNCEPIVRVFRVMINGSKPANLKWIVKQVLRNALLQHKSSSDSNWIIEMIRDLN
jgi:hypothetical protein